MDGWVALSTRTLVACTDVSEQEKRREEKRREDTRRARKRDETRRTSDQSLGLRSQITRKNS
eukprot:755365-Hanusia_phi.AAC.3